MRACIFCPSSLKILFLSEINHILHTTHLTRGQLEASIDGMTQQRRKSRRPKKTAMISILEAAQRFGDPNVAGPGSWTNAGLTACVVLGAEPTTRRR